MRLEQAKGLVNEYFEKLQESQEQEEEQEEGLGALQKSIVESLEDFYSELEKLSSADSSNLEVTAEGGGAAAEVGDEENIFNPESVFSLYGAVFKAKVCIIQKKNSFFVLDNQQNLLRLNFRKFYGLIADIEEGQLEVEQIYSVLLKPVMSSIILEHLFKSAKDNFENSPNLLAILEQEKKIIIQGLRKNKEDICDSFFIKKQDEFGGYIEEGYQCDVADFVKDFLIEQLDHNLSELIGAVNLVPDLSLSTNEEAAAAAAAAAAEAAVALGFDGDSFSDLGNPDNYQAHSPTGAIRPTGSPYQLGAQRRESGLPYSRT